MNILDAIASWAGLSAPSLRNLLQSASAISPDLKPTADEWLARLDQAVTDENLGALVAALPGELRNILRGALQPEDHPSDFA